MTALVFALLLAPIVPSQVHLEAAAELTPKLVNAKLELVPAGGRFKEVFAEAQRRPGPHWIGYSVPITQQPRFVCCSDESIGPRRAANCCGSCALERRGGHSFSVDDRSCTPAGTPRALVVLFRAEAGALSTVRPFTSDCELDAGNLPVVWLQGVSAADSLALLEGLTAAWTKDGREVTNAVARGALPAIALHGDPAADHALERLMSAGRPAGLRRDAAFWVASERGRAGFELLSKLVHGDADPKFRREATFALSQSTEHEDAARELVSLARHDPDGEVRSQALFWLAHEAMGAATETISEVVENDPETRVRRQAVFALSQLPGGAGVPLLTKYATTHRDRAVRKEAIFWLGQSDDPRALDALERLILTK